MTPSLEPVRDPSAWTAADLARDRSWDYEFSARGQRELEDALRLVQEHGLALAEITREAFPLPSLQEMLGDVQHQLRAGRGFALLRGVPVDGHSLDDLESVLGLGTYLVARSAQRAGCPLVTDGKLSAGRHGEGRQPARWHRLDCDASGCVCIRRPGDRPAWRPAILYNEILAASRLCAPVRDTPGPDEGRPRVAGVRLPGAGVQCR